MLTNTGNEEIKLPLHIGNRDHHPWQSTVNQPLGLKQCLTECLLPDHSQCLHWKHLHNCSHGSDCRLIRIASHVFCRSTKQKCSWICSCTVQCSTTLVVLFAHQFKQGLDGHSLPSIPTALAADRCCQVCPTLQPGNELDEHACVQHFLTEATFLAGNADLSSYYSMRSIVAVPDCPCPYRHILTPATSHLQYKHHCLLLAEIALSCNVPAGKDFYWYVNILCLFRVQRLPMSCHIHQQHV